MNKLQMRQTLETILGYYNYNKDASGNWVKTENQDCPGFYYYENEPFKPAFFMEGMIRVPSSWDAKGLETVMEEVPVVRSFSLQGGYIERWQTWTIWMRQWNLDKTIEPFQVALARHFGKQANFSRFREYDNIIPNQLKIVITTKDWDLGTYVEGSRVMNPPSPIENSPFKTHIEQ